MSERTYFGENDFYDSMRNIALPVIQSNLKEGDLTGEGNINLHYYELLHPKERAAVVIFHGFCEFFGKYHELAYYLFREGCSIFFLEQRGHGHSDRECENCCKVHVRDFMEYVRDQKTFVDQVVKKEMHSDRLLLFAHSMGGLVGGLYLEQYPKDFEQAILSSPMLEINYGGVPKAAAVFMGILARIRRKTKEYAPGGHDFTPEADFEHSSQLSPARYQYMFDQRLQNTCDQTSSATYGWAIASMKGVKVFHKNADKIRVPVLILQAGKDTMVDISGQDRFQKENPHVRIERFPNAKHEIFNSTTEDRSRFYDLLLDCYFSSNRL